jgi:hypothetical protein
MVSRAWRHRNPSFVMAPDRVFDCVPAGCSFSEPNWFHDEQVRSILIREDPRFATGGIRSQWKHCKHCPSCCFVPLFSVVPQRLFWS